MLILIIDKIKYNNIYNDWDYEVYQINTDIINPVWIMNKNKILNL